MNLNDVTAYNVRNGSTTRVSINPAQITTVTYGDIIATADGDVELAKINFSGGESIYTLSEVVDEMMRSRIENKYQPPAFQNEKLKVKAAPKAKPKVKKEKKNEAS